MPTSILIGYATQYGSTKEIAEKIAEVLGERGFAVTIQPLKEVRSLVGFEAVVLGAALYMYRWHKDAHRFLSKHRKDLIGRPVAVFALGPVKDPHDEQEWQNSRAQLEKELAKYPWLKPVAVEMFGGRFDPALLRFPLNKFAASEPASDIRDWEIIQAWAGELAEKFISTGE